MLSNSNLAYTQHDHRRCAQAALQQARRLCLQRGRRLTGLRESVLRLVWQSHRPLGAYRIVDQLSELNGKRVRPPTVYRSLEFLLELGLIHRLATLNAYIGCPFPGSEHSDLFLLCRICGGVAECSAPVLNRALDTTAARVGFQPERQIIEVQGLCQACRDTGEREPA